MIKTCQFCYEYRLTRIYLGKPTCKRCYRNRRQFRLAKRYEKYHVDNQNPGE